MSDLAAVWGLSTITCYAAGCGIQFAVPVSWEQNRRADHECFYCPNGHKQHFPGKSEAEMLRDELAAKRRSLEAAERRLDFEKNQRRHADHQARAFKGAATKIRKRVAHGVCPCCNRSFENLRRHMATKHPDVVKRTKP